MIKVKIYGAGSIGNHYYACYKKKWNITIIDKDPKALVRMEKIFPSRYGFGIKKLNCFQKMLIHILTLLLLVLHQSHI